MLADGLIVDSTFFSIIAPALKVKVGIHLGGLFVINIAYPTTGPAIKTFSNLLKGRNKYPWEHTSKTKMNQNKESIGGSSQR